MVGPLRRRVLNELQRFVTRRYGIVVEINPGLDGCDVERIPVNDGDVLHFCFPDSASALTSAEMLGDLHRRLVERGMPNLTYIATIDCDIEVVSERDMYAKGWVRRAPDPVVMRQTRQSLERIERLLG